MNKILLTPIAGTFGVAFVYNLPDMVTLERDRWGAPLDLWVFTEAVNRNENYIIDAKIDFVSKPKVMKWGDGKLVVTSKGY